MKKYKFFITFLFFSILFSCREIHTPLEPAGNDTGDGPGFSQILITYPTGGQTFTPGAMINIRWNWVGDAERINIELYKKDLLMLNIAENIPNESRFSWNIPLDLRNSHHYRIKITDARNDNTYKWSGFFYILKN